MLEVSQVSVRYGANVAVDAVDLEVKPGEIVALVGANGAGKSSLMKAIAGLTPSSGRISFQGRDLGDRDTPDRVRSGLIHVLEQRGTFADLTVQENLDLGAFVRAGTARAVIAAELETIFALFPRLRERRATKAGSLSGGEQQMLVIGRALMAAPKLLLLDEPSLGLAPVVIAEIARALRRLNRDHGLSLLVSEQNSELGLSLANRAYVLQRGRFVLSGTGEELSRRGDVIQFYLGPASSGARRSLPDLPPQEGPMNTQQRLAQYFTTDKQRNFETNFLANAKDYEAWDEVEIGKPQRGKLTYEVKAEDIISYNRSVLESDPLMVDEKAAKKSTTGELIQHPIFVTQLGFYCIERGPGSWIRSPGARNPGQRIEVHEPFKIGENITMTVTPTDKWIRRDKHYITDRLDFHNEQGTLKATWWLTLIIPPRREKMLEFARR